MVTLPIAAVGLLAVVITGSYRKVERAAIMVGLFELAFLFVAWAARPDVHDCSEAVSTSPMATGTTSIWARPILAQS